MPAAAKQFEVNGESTKSFADFKLGLENSYREERDSLPPDPRNIDRPPNELALTNAWHVLDRLKRKDVVPSAIVPAARGGVEICLEQNAKCASFECLNTGTLLHVISDRRGNVRVSKVVPLNDSEVDHAIAETADFLTPTVSGRNQISGR